MKKRITEVLGIDVLPNYWDKRYVKNLDKLSRPKYEVELHSDVWLTFKRRHKNVHRCISAQGSRKGSGAGKLVCIQQGDAGLKARRDSARVSGF